MAVMVPNEVFQRLYESGAKLETDADVLAAMRGDTTADPAEVADVLGGEYRLGNVTLPPLSLGCVPNLEIIESAFLDASKGAYSMRDIMNAAYVLAAGRDAVRDLSLLARNRAALEKYRGMAEKSPQLMRAFLDKVTDVEGAWARFEDAAAAFWATVGPVNMQDVAETIISILNRAFGGFAMLPGDATEPGDGEAAPTVVKKNGLTPNGQQTY